MTIFKYLMLSFGLSFLIMSTAQAKESLFCSNQLLSHPIPKGNTWTLTSRLGKILSIAEKEFGERDKSWTILGIEFTDAEQPSIWYPFGYKAKNIIIQLTRNTSRNELKALYQLAHEVFHTLSPNAEVKTNMLEEGLATYFSIKALQEMGFKISPQYIAAKKYKKAYQLVAQLYKKHPETSQLIQSLRRQELKLSELSADDIKIFFSNIDQGLARQLANKFDP